MNPKNITAVDISRAQILVVDDMQYNRESICAHLRQVGFKFIREAGNGREALTLVRTWKPDVIILDLIMPELDGLSFLKIFHEMPLNQQTVVIVQTGEVKFKSHCFDAGADDYLLKPIDFNELEARVRVHLENRLLVKELKNDAQRMNDEITLARQVQHAALPPREYITDIEEQFGLTIASLYEPFHELGGDVWGVIPISERYVCFYIADLVGHGLHTALKALQVQTAVKMTTFRSTSPAKILTQLGAQLKKILAVGEYVTACCLVYDKETRTLAMAAAGAPSALFYRGDALWQNPELSGLPLGIIADATYAELSFAMMPEDTVLLYSDALPEAHDDRGNYFDMTSAHRVMARSSLSLKHRLETLDNATLKLTDNKRQDDLTLVALTIR